MFASHDGAIKNLLIDLVWNWISYCLRIVKVTQIMKVLINVIVEIEIAFVQQLHDWEYYSPNERGQFWP